MQAMKAYSMDLRRKILEALSTGTPKAQVARSFGVGLSTVKRYAGRAERGEGLAPRKSPGKRRKVDSTAQRGSSSATWRNAPRPRCRRDASCSQGWPGSR